MFECTVCVCQAIYATCTCDIYIYIFYTDYGRNYILNILRWPEIYVLYVFQRDMYI